MSASYECVVQGLLVDQIVENKLHFLTDEFDNTNTGTEAVADSFVTDILPDFLDCLPADYTAQTVTARGIIALDGGTMTTPPQIIGLPAYPGTRTGTVLSNQNGPLISWYIDTFAGERVRTGKLFLPGITEADADENVITAAGLLTAMDNLITTLEVPRTVGAITIDWVAIIKKIVDDALITIVRGITSALARGTIASQRRRRPK